ncbi:hypothetical protein [Streptomyces sp. NBC_00878]|uniref:hypothetical protein n=1 Tax=Streptomyces sp. NBC_00878 TaxID=2975854 RepID=UPI002259ADA1|nr:hypothetical protein [Streptomyces sp. NBC_00878]MCX4911890.1 hypothetical protein [Streptomyces sp. NBC_00878]
MGIGDDTAANSLRLLNNHFRHTPPVTGPQGHSYISSEPRPTPTAPGLPYNADVADHIRACVTEVTADVLAVNPAPTPLPGRVEAVYTWYLDNTRTAAPAQRQRRDTIIYRQTLEHAIAMRDFKVIPPHRCPACRTFGLRWAPARRRALCTNMKCVADDGMSNTWTLARLAYEHIAARENHGRVSAT